MAVVDSTRDQSNPCVDNQTAEVSGDQFWPKVLSITTYKFRIIRTWVVLLSQTTATCQVGPSRIIPTVSLSLSLATDRVPLKMEGERERYSLRSRRHRTAVKAPRVVVVYHRCYANFRRKISRSFQLRP